MRLRRVQFEHFERLEQLELTLRGGNKCTKLELFRGMGPGQK